MKFLSVKPEDFKDKIYESKSNLFVTIPNFVGVLLAMVVQITFGVSVSGSQDNIMVALFLWVMILSRCLKPESYPFANRNILNVAWSLGCLLNGGIILILYIVSDKGGFFTALLISTLQLELWIIFTTAMFIILEIKYIINDYDQLEFDKREDGDNKVDVKL